MDTFQVMAKPIGPVCNLCCEYCFYRHKVKKFSREHDWKMDRKTLEVYVRAYIESQPNGVPVTFVWQGGEPTLRGLDFFEDAVELQKKYQRPGQEIANAFQTNAVLVDSEWARFFKENHFLVGVSVDGPGAIHDHYRKDAAGHGSFDKVMRGVDHLRTYGVEHNALVCVTDISIEDPLLIYSFISKAFDFIQFIPVVQKTDFVSQAPFIKHGRGQKKPKNDSSSATSWSVNADGWGHFLNTVFDEWLRHDVGRIFVQIFDETLAHTMGYPGGLCMFDKTCGRAMALEHNGDLYACDHFVYPEYWLGNIKDRELKAMALSGSQIAFGRDKFRRLPGQCRRCEYLGLCGGGCPRNRFIKTKNKEEGLNYLCQGYQAYFSHTARAMQYMAGEIMQQRPASNVMQAAEPLIS